MRSLVLATVVLALAGGCKKAKPKQPDSDPPPPPAQPAAKGNPGGGGGGGNVGIVPSPVGGGIVTNTGGGGGGGGAIQAVRKAVRRTDALNEMRTLGQVISLMQTNLGRMPTKEQIVAELKQYPKLLAASNEGSIILTGTTQAGGLWAYEVDAENVGGITLVGGTAGRTSADDVRHLLRGN
jgi:hypothetical protein